MKTLPHSFACLLFCRPLRVSFALLVASLVLSVWTQAAVRMPLLFSDHMVLQRDAPLCVWGWADPGEAVSVTLGSLKARTVADATGHWKLHLSKSAANALGQALVVVGKNTLRFEDVVVGDVWLCSGQSNMAMYLGECDNAQEVLPHSADPLLRVFRAVERLSFAPQEDLGGLWNGRTWRRSAPEEVDQFSAVAYFFGRELRRTQQVPIGLISASMGGTRVQLYMRPETFAKRLDADPAFRIWLQERKQAILAAGTTPTKMPPDAQFSKSLVGILYNGMIAPLTPCAIKGVIWYQGESNCDEAKQYGILFPLLIRDWRQAWGQGDFPFLFVQLPNIGVPATEPVQNKDRWVRIREAQTRALALPHTGMAVAIDVGDVDVHPKSKIDVGLRLARQARQVAYGERLVASGPTFKALRIEGATAWLSFDHVGGGLMIGVAPAAPSRKSRPLASELSGFAIAGADRVWYKADARIAGSRLALSSASVLHPVAVRYGWADNPPCNLYNAEGLPAAPFRTDAWEP